MVASSSRVAQKRRYALVLSLGGRCSCGGEDCWHEGECSVIDPRCLQLDHISGDGAVSRRKFGGSISMVNYYYYRIDEAKGQLQILCSNCNWVKRQRNGEVRGGKPCSDPMDIMEKHDLVVSRFTGLSLYHSLVSLYRSLLSSTPSFLKIDLLDDLGQWGVSEDDKHPMSFYLMRSWRKQRFYGTGEEDLSCFLSERIRVLKSIGNRVLGVPLKNISTK